MKTGELLSSLLLILVHRIRSRHQSEAEVVDFVKERGLAKYKWPEKIIFAPVPRNPSGKIEKPKLRELYVKPAQ